MSVIACAHCDLIQTHSGTTGRFSVYCVRCGSLLLKSRPNSINNTCAWTIASLVLFVVAVYFPFLGLTESGIDRQTALLTGVHEIYLQEMYLLAILVLITCIVAPLLQIFGLLYIFVPLKFGIKLHYVESIFRLFRHVQPWNMMEVFMVGILVSLVKIDGIATIVPGVALYAFALLIICLAFAVSSVDPHAVWIRIEGLSGD